MHEHVTQYLDAERLRLRAERAERLARGWRNAALILLALLCLQTWLVVDTALELGRSRQAADRLAEDRARLEQSVAVWHQAAMSGTDNAQWYSGELARQDEYFTRAIHRGYELMTERDEARERFRVCLSANQGLVSALRDFDRVSREQRQLVLDQQLLLGEAIEAAKRCDATPVTWALVTPVVSEVRFDAR